MSKKEAKEAIHPEDIETYIRFYRDYYQSMENDYIYIFDNQDDEIRRIKLYLCIGSEIDVLFQLLCKCVDETYSGDNINIHRFTYYNHCINGDMDDIDLVVKTEDEDLRPWMNYGDTDNQHFSWWKGYNDVKHSRMFRDKSGVLGGEKATIGNIKYALAALFILENEYLTFLSGYSGDYCLESKLFKL